MRILPLALLIMMCLAACAARPHRDTDEVYRAPPLAFEEAVEPRPGFIWIAGHYAWDEGLWIWRRGHFEAERQGCAWDAGRWEKHGKVVWFWNEGRWYCRR